MTDYEKQSWTEIRKKGEFHFVFIRSLLQIGLPCAIGMTAFSYLINFGFIMPLWNSWDFQHVIRVWGAEGLALGLISGEFIWKRREKEFQK